MPGDSHKRKHSSSDEEADLSDRKVELKRQRSGDLSAEDSKPIIDVKDENETSAPKSESGVNDEISETKTSETENLPIDKDYADANESQVEEKVESAEGSGADEISEKPTPSETTLADKSTAAEAIESNKDAESKGESSSEDKGDLVLSKDDGEKQSTENETPSEKTTEKTTETKVFGSGLTSATEQESSKNFNESGKSVFGSASDAGKSATTGSVFGSGAVFGASSWSSSSLPTKNVFADLDSSGSNSPATSASSNGKVFGSGSLFGASSSAPLSGGETKNIFESLPEKKEEEEKVISTVVGEQKEDNPDLQVREIETGEESEEPVYSCRAKLYALDITAEQIGWKERGVGTLHVNNSTKSESDKKRSRIVMRSDGSLRVILNVLLTPKTEIQRGLKSSFASEKFVRLTGVEDGKPIQYAIKTGNANTGEELFEAIQKLITL